MVARCSWAEHDELRDYHDQEWGVPVHGDSRLFELLTLEGAQAGLSWLIVLRRRAGYRSAFSGFDPEVVARFSSADVDRLVEDPDIIRHRGKIESTVTNAAALVAHRDKVRDALATSLAPAIDRSGLPASLRSPKGLAQAVIAIHDGAATELLLDSDPDRFRDRLTDLLTALLDHPTSKSSTANTPQPS